MLLAYRFPILLMLLSCSLVPVEVGICRRCAKMTGKVTQMVKFDLNMAVFES